MIKYTFDNTHRLCENLTKRRSPENLFLHIQVEKGEGGTQRNTKKKLGSKHFWKDFTIFYLAYNTAICIQTKNFELWLLQNHPSFWTRIPMALMFKKFSSNILFQQKKPKKQKDRHQIRFLSLLRLTYIWT